MNTTLCIIGAGGRMGRMLTAAACATPGLQVAAATEIPDSPLIGQDAGVLAGVGAIGVPVTGPDAAPKADIAIDFTFHTAVPGNIGRAIAAGATGYILGTTGLTDEEGDAVREAAKRIPIVWAPNFSLGVNILLDLVKRTAALLDESYDVEIVEMHHRHKKDAPSGTALGLAEAAAAGRGTALRDTAIYGRQGVTGERPHGQIAIHALRGGDVVGDHTVIFAADGERVELTHKASSRSAFAFGAMRAALWLPGRKAGLYSMRDVLGLA
jgi:4-hydroxy-tetrahydrodipicolinate reductase